MKTRILALVLALVLLLPFALSCNGNTVGDGTAADDGIVSEIIPESSEKPEDTTPPDTTEPDNSLTVTPDNATTFRIVIPLTAPIAIYNAGVSLANVIGESLGCAAPKVVRDNTEPYENEISIGNTNREKTAEIASTLRARDYTVSLSGSTFYLIGGNDTATVGAITYFAESIKKGGDGLTFDPDEPYCYLADYPIRSITVDGVDLRSYTIVKPAVSDYYIKYTVDMFNEFLMTNAGYKLTSVSDATQETKYEILIGNTSRTASKTEETFSAGEYSLSKSGDKIVCHGANQFIGGGLSDILGKLPTSGTNQSVAISGFPNKIEAKTFKFKEARSAVLLIGDGMGFNSILAAKIAGKVADFSGYHLPYQGESKTNSLSGTTDSAAGGTALATGYKTINGYLGMDKNQKPVLNLRALADSVGAKTAVITTDAITGATPGAFLVHHNNRNDTAIIQGQIDLLITDRSVDYTAGSVGDNLLSHTRKALSLISENNSSFFLMIEEGYIDKYSHNNEFENMFKALARFDATIKYVSAFTVMHPDTVMIITADHETGGIKCAEAQGVYRYTSTSHTNVNVPILAMGAGTEIFHGKAVENIEIAKFLAKIFGEETFGQ
jgi:hypothetical protein